MDALKKEHIELSIFLGYLQKNMLRLVYQLWLFVFYVLDGKHKST